MKNLILVLIITALSLTSLSSEASGLPPTCDVIDAKKVRPVPKNGFIGNPNKLYVITMNPSHDRNTPKCSVSGDKIAFFADGTASHHLVCDNNITSISELRQKRRGSEGYYDQPNRNGFANNQPDVISVGMLPVHGVSSSGYINPNGARYTSGMRAGNMVKQADNYYIDNSIGDVTSTSTSSSHSSSRSTGAPVTVIVEGDEGDEIDIDIDIDNPVNPVDPNPNGEAPDDGAGTDIDTPAPDDTAGGPANPGDNSGSNDDTAGTGSGTAPDSSGSTGT